MTVIDLATVEDVKGYLSINSSVDDPLLARLVTAASAFIQTWLNRNIGAQQYTDNVSGNGNPKLLFKNYPVSAVTSVTIDGRSIPPSAGAQERGYAFDQTTLYLRGERFVPGALNVSVTYTAGYAQVPAELTQACVELVAMRYKEKDRVGLASKGLAGETTAYSLKDMPESVKAILRNYRKVVPN